MTAAPALSVVIPARNERPNLRPLLVELEGVLAAMGRPYEVIVVDDGSTDGSAQELGHLMDGLPALRVLCLPARGDRGQGQSAAFAAGFRAAGAPLIASMDGDRQHDPADLPRLLDAMERSGADLVQGDRTASRADGAMRRFVSAIGRGARRELLGDPVRDTGCSLRVMRRELALRLPLELRGMHRFIPITARQMGYQVTEVAVSHRRRPAGRSHYGILDRGSAGLVDLLGVIWMARRRCTIDAEERRRGQPAIEIVRGATAPAPPRERAGAAP